MRRCLASCRGLCFGAICIGCGCVCQQRHAESGGVGLGLLVGRGVIRFVRCVVGFLWRFVFAIGVRFHSMVGVLRRLFGAGLYGFGRFL